MKRLIAPHERSGFLEALEYTSDGMLRCLCRKCGGEYAVRPARFRSHSECDVCRRKIQIGEQYHGLLVIGLSGERYGSEPLYLCRCLFCGKEIKLRPYAVLRNKSCGCTVDATAIRSASMKGVEKSIAAGTQLYVATKESPNSNNETGFRWVRVLKRRGKEFIFASFTFRGQRYYRGGFSNKESAYEWALDEHRKLLAEAGITDPRKNGN